MSVKTEEDPTLKEGPKDEYGNLIINETLSSTPVIVAKIILGAVGLVAYLSYFKWTFENTDMRVWEDMYGRAFFFFLPSVGSYLVSSRRNDNISFFEL